MMASGDGTFSVMQAQSSGVSSEATSMLANFWTNVMNDMRHIKDEQLKQQELPLARIKKIMKLDEDVKMISAEAPVLFAKAAEVFVSELSLRAWIHTEENKRRTLQRNDIAMAITKFDQFDFLIDIVPREELKPTKRTEEVRTTSVLPDQIQYFLQLAQQQAQQQHQQQQQQQQQQKQQQVIVTSSAAQPQAAPVQHTVTVSQPGQQIGQPFQIIGQPGVVTSLVSNAGSTINVPSATLAGQPQVITIQAPQVQHTTQQVQQPVQQVQHVQQAQPTQQQTQQTQVFQQVITASGEVQNIPIQLTQAQLQAIQMQLQGKHTNQPIIIQTSGAQSMQTDQVNQFAQSTVYQVQQLAAGGGQQVYIQQAGGDHEQTGDGAQS